MPSEPTRGWRSARTAARKESFWATPMIGREGRLPSSSDKLERIKQSTARLERLTADEDGPVIRGGTAFLVRDGYLVTCRHCVLQRDQAIPPPGTLLNLTFTRSSVPA